MSTAIIVVPCYNEAQRLDVASFRRFVDGGSNLRFLLVNDGSRDATLQVLASLAGADPLHFDVLDLQENRGKAEAVRLGVLEASRRATDYIGYWDADLATPLNAIPTFVAALDRRPDTSVALGARLPLLGRSIRRRAMRKLIGRSFARAASSMLRTPIYDTQCGAKLFRAQSEIIAAFSQPFRSRWIFDVELLARWSHLAGASSNRTLSELLYEVPLDHWEDVGGSKLKKRDFVKAVAELSAIWWHYLRPGAARFTPTHWVGDPRSRVIDRPESITRRAA